MTTAARAAVVKRFSMAIPALRTGKFSVLPVGLRNGSIDMGHSVTSAYTWNKSDALITAHTDHNGPALFNRLASLHKGNLVKFYRGGGLKVYTVTSVRNVRDIGTKLMNRIYNGGSAKWLVTCALSSYHDGRYHAWTVVRTVPS